MEIMKLIPTGKDYLWGGTRLREEYGKQIDLTPLAETWECSVHPDGPSYVVGGEFDGKELAEVLKAHPEYLGERHKGECTLPILIKFIDAKKDLSVQVHPTDEYAKDKESMNEWYFQEHGELPDFEEAKKSTDEWFLRTYGKKPEETKQEEPKEEDK